MCYLSQAKIPIKKCNISSILHKIDPTITAISKEKWEFKGARVIQTLKSLLVAGEKRSCDEAFGLQPR